MRSDSTLAFSKHFKLRHQWLVLLNLGVDFVVEVDILLANEVDHFAWLAHAACSTYALKVLLSGLGVLKLNYVAHIHRVQAS